jgi:hypothetical protein
MLGRDLAFAVRGYGQCAVTARSPAVTERLADEIAKTIRRWRRRPRVTLVAMENLAEAVARDNPNGALRIDYGTALLDALRDGPNDVRFAATRALGLAAGSDPRVVPALLDALRDGDDDYRFAAADALGSAAGSDPRVVPALLDALRDSNDYVRSWAAGALGAARDTNPEAMAGIFRQVWRTANRSVSAFATLSSLIAKVVEGRQLPGYRWVGLKTRRLRRAKLRKIAIGPASALGIALAIWFGAEKVAGLPMDSPIKLFLTAVPAVAALLGLLWGLVLVIRGEKRTLWG